MSAIGKTAGRAVSQAWIVSVPAFAAGVGYLSVTRHREGLATAMLPVAAMLALYPWWPLAAAIALLPIQRDIVGNTLVSGTSISGLSIALPDVLIAVAVVGSIPLLLLQENWRERIRDARPGLLWSAPFFVWLAIVVADHPSEKSAANGVQYFELTVLVMVLAVLLLDRRMVRLALPAFIVVAAVTSVLWIGKFGLSFSGNKNPAGQFMVDAAILSLVVVKRWQYRYPVLLLLVVGTLFTESRGAVLGAVIGAIVLFAFRGLGSWRRTVGTLAPIALIVVIGYNVVPVSLQSRVESTFSSVDLPQTVQGSNSINGGLSSAEYSIQLRRIYRREGIAYVEQHPVLGVGLGNYLTGDPTLGTLTNQPHDVLLLNAGEGGVPDMVLFVVMILGTSIVVLRRIRYSPWVGPALAVQAAILTHGLVDVYWVRGTPVIGWVLVGMALNKRLDYDRTPPSLPAPISA